MKYHVVSAEYLSGYVIILKFRDGTVGEIDLSSELTGPVFEPLRELETFKRFRVHPEFHTTSRWPMLYGKPKSFERINTIFSGDDQ